MPGPAQPCNRPVESRSSTSKCGIRRRLWPTAETARPRLAENHRGRDELPNIPSCRGPNPDSDDRRATAESAPGAPHWLVSRARLCLACPVCLVRNWTPPASTRPPTLPRFSRCLPGGQLLPAFENQLGGLHRAHPGVLGVLGDRRPLDRDLIADLDRVAFPAAARQRIGRPELKAEFFRRATFVFHVEENVGVRIHPVHFGDEAG